MHELHSQVSKRLVEVQTVHANYDTGRHDNHDTIFELKISENKMQCSVFCIVSSLFILLGEMENRKMRAESCKVKNCHHSWHFFYLPVFCEIWKPLLTRRSLIPSPPPPSPPKTKNQKKNKQNKFTFMGMLFVEKISTSNIASFTSRGAHGKIKWDNSTQKTHISIQSNILLMYRFIHAVRISQVVFQ